MKRCGITAVIHFPRFLKQRQVCKFGRNRLKREFPVLFVDANGSFEIHSFDLSHYQLRKYNGGVCTVSFQNLLLGDEVFVVTLKRQTYCVFRIRNLFFNLNVA